MSDLLIDDIRLMKEWNYEKNTIDVTIITVGSGKKVWWKCEKGHEWQANVNDRRRGNNCPYCSGKRPIVGYNDLETLYYEIAMEWNCEKNGDKRPNQYCAHSGKKVWWKCKNGHEWQATIDSRTRNGNGCPYCAGQRVIFGENDLVTKVPELAKQWNYEKNGDLQPEEICYSSGKKVWWKCEKGHEWRVSVNSRYTQKTGCPLCSREYKTSFPEQAILYYLNMVIDSEVYNGYKCSNGMEIDIFMPELSLGIEYDGIAFHSSQEQIIRDKRKNEYCKKQNIRLVRIKEARGYKYDELNVIYRDVTAKDKYIELDKCIVKLLNIIASDYSVNVLDINVNTRNEENAIMSKYKNQIKKHKDYIYKQWDYSKNGLILPEMLSESSHKKIWWKCEKGHSWQTAMYHRCKENATGCPYCCNQKVLRGFNDLETVYPELTKEWDFEKNNDNPSDYTSKSYHKVWWKCSNGHSWVAGINKRVLGQGCPICKGKIVLEGYNDFASLYPEIAKEWNYARNTGIKPNAVTKGSNKKVWWKCKDGHEWECTINKRVYKKSKCPFCNIVKKIM